MVLSAVILVMASVAYCQSVSTDSSATSTYSSISGVRTSVPFWFPIVGLSDDASAPWGANISTEQYRTYSYEFELYDIIIADTESAPVREGPDEFLTEGPPILEEEDHPDGFDFEVQVLADGDASITLGPNSDLAFRVIGSYAGRFPTVPFGINLGRNGFWNGSVSVGGYYDSNRIYSDSWMLLPGTEQGGSSFSRDGTLELETVIRAGRMRYILPGILDFNSDAITLPSKLRCNEPLLITISRFDGLIDITVPANLTASKDRCVVREEGDGDNGTVILGRPFFQAAYTYVDADDKVYLAAANQYDLPVAVKVFQANAMLLPVPSPTSTPPDWPAPISISSPRGIAQIFVLIPSFLCLALFFALV